MRSHVCTLESKAKDRRNEHHIYILSPIIKETQENKEYGGYRFTTEMERKSGQITASTFYSTFLIEYSTSV